MGLEGTFGLASLGKRRLTRSFAMFSSGHAVLQSNGKIMPIHGAMPAMPHFSSGASSFSAGASGQYTSPMYQIMMQQLEFQQQQLKFQERQHDSNEGQVHLIKEMLANFDNSFRGMMDIVSKVVTASTPAVQPEIDSSEYISFQKPYVEDNVVSISDKQ